MHLGDHLFEIEAFGGGFQQDVGGLSDDGPSSGKDERADESGHEGIGVDPSGGFDDDASDDDSGGGRGVSGHVDEAGAHVEAGFGAFHEEPGHDRVEEDAGAGGPDHEVALDGLGVFDSGDGLGEDDDADRNEAYGVEESSEDVGAVVTVGFALVGGSLGDVDGPSDEREGDGISDVVSGVG